MESKHKLNIAAFGLRFFFCIFAASFFKGYSHEKTNKTHGLFVAAHTELFH